MANWVHSACARARPKGLGKDGPVEGDGGALGGRLQRAVTAASRLSGLVEVILGEAVLDGAARAAELARGEASVRRPLHRHLVGRAAQRDVQLLRLLRGVGHARRAQAQRPAPRRGASLGEWRTKC